MEVSGECCALAAFSLGSDSYNQFRCFREEKNLLLLPGFEPWIVQPEVYFLIAHCLIAVQTTLLQLVIYSVLLPVCMLAMAVTAVCKYCCSVSDMFHVLIPNVFFNYTSQPAFPIIPFLGMFTKR
jgi:hypothetical protein